VTRTDWVQGPDGLPARVVGPWVDDKVHYVDRYASIFATGMKNAWPRRGYLELFAGPGLSVVRGTDRLVDGSAIRALDREFTDYVYVDLDPVAVDALRQRIASRALGTRRVEVLDPMDCNASVPSIRGLVPSGALTLAFIDPTNWQVRLDTVAALADHRRVDLLMTFHTGSMVRMGLVEDTSRLDAFFGTDAWRAALTRPRWEKARVLLETYNRQLEPLGYDPSCHQYAVPVLNSRGRAIYQLVLFTKNERGVEFWREAIKRPLQETLWDERAVRQPVPRTTIEGPAS
jgi:three-Cys-motif partner protein